MTVYHGVFQFKFPKWSDPFPDPAQVGASCTELPFMQQGRRCEKYEMTYI
jgi:hypothetical protein